MKAFIKIFTFINTIIYMFFAVNYANANQQIRAVGSSTAYPFIADVAEHFANSTGNKTPIVESIGTGGGFFVFCAGVGEDQVDISNASRKITDFERELCKNNNVTDIIEIPFGYDGITIAESADSPVYNFSKEILVKALANQIVVNGKLVKNPYKKWSDIDKKMPDSNIEVYGPPSSSGTRDYLVNLIFYDYCMKNLKFYGKGTSSAEAISSCKEIRKDGRYIDAGENDNLIVKKIKNNPSSIGIFGYSYFINNKDSLRASKIQDIEPSHDTIYEGTYPLARPLYIYVKKQHFSIKPNIKLFIQELISDKAIGKDGYLVKRGLISLHDDELNKLREGLKEKLR